MKKPWNIVQLPVYSVVSNDGDKWNMNICTYVSAVSMKPKRYIVAVYHGTKTLENLQQQKTFILQLLQKDQYKLVSVLGKKSGLRYDKEKYLQRKNQLTDWRGYQVLSAAAAWLELKIIRFIPAGDHDLFLCDVLNSKVNVQENILTTQWLSEKKIIRI
jgi:flavin reductase (DIM6/NTAB) family NADH-FMN oxidoreductase RutF